MPTWTRTRNDSIREATDRLTDQFYVTLLAAHARIRQRNSASEEDSLLELTKSLLEKEPRGWGTAYHVEQLLVPHHSDSELELEMERRLLDARKLLEADVYASYQNAWQRILSTKDAMDRRDDMEVLLLRIINDLQWKYELAEAKKAFDRRLTNSTAMFFIFSFAAFLTYVIAATGWLLSGADGATAPEAVEAANTIVYRQPVLFYFFTVGLAILAGSLGASFSMLMGLKSRLNRSTLDDLKILHTRSNVATRALIGICAGLVVFYFVRSGLLTGPLVPDLVVQQQNYDIFEAIALLVVWCFLGGFSEKLVPTLLTKTEGQAGVVGAERPRSTHADDLRRSLRSIGNGLPTGDPIENGDVPGDKKGTPTASQSEHSPSKSPAGNGREEEDRQELAPDDDEG